MFNGVTPASGRCSDTGTAGSQDGDRVVQTVIRYGTAGCISGRWENLQVVADCGCRRRAAVGDVAGAARHAVLQPIEFPPIARSVIPDDRVAVLLGSDVPRGMEIAAGVVAELLQAGLKPEAVTLLRSAGWSIARADGSPWGLPEHIDQRIRCMVHNPDAPEQMAFLTALESGAPIRLNRSIVDADMVIPVGRIRPPQSTGYFGVYSALFPAFSDRQSIDFCHRGSAPENATRPRQDAFRTAKQVAWLLGAQFTVQVVPGAGGQVLEVLAGKIDAVGSRAQSLYDAAWRHQVSNQAKLVVATLGREKGVDGRLDLIRALRVASPLVEPGGAVLVCSEIDSLAPPPYLSDDARAGPIDETPTSESPTSNAPPGAAVGALLQRVLQEVLDRASVYLLSDLPSELVEQLGMTPVADDVEASRLLGHFRSCTVLRDAPDLLVSPGWM